MPNTGEPNIGNNIQWTKGDDEMSVLTKSGRTKRVRGGVDGHDVSAKDINELRHVIEGLANHSHSYQDNVGGGC